MNLRSIDLNLLVVLDALLDEAHVSRAAARLGLSQPAASSALERCRQLFNDPLLTRGAGGMKLTPRAEALRAPLKDALAGIRRAVAPPEPDLKSLRQIVRIVIADYPAAIIAGPLVHNLAASAPGVDIVLQPWRSAEAALNDLEAGSTDLAVSVFPAGASWLRRILLLEERYRIVMRKDHPAAADFNLERWLDFPHLIVSGRGERHGALDEELVRRGLERRVGIVVPSFMLAAPVLEDTDLIAMLPSRCIKDDAGAFAVFDPPLPVPGFPLHLARHKRSDSDPVLEHVSELITKLVR